MPDLTPPQATTAVLGDGRLARFLAKALGGPVVGRNAADTDWDWPRDFVGDTRRLLLVAVPGGGLAEVVRWHGDAWRCPGIRRLCSGVAGLADESVRALASRGVFGCGETTSPNSFAGWAKHVALIPASASLEILRRQMARLSPCLVTTWARHRYEASVLPPLVQAISMRDAAALAPALREAARVDWDAVCFPHGEFGGSHAYAKRVRDWLARAAFGAETSWAEGKDLLDPLTARLS